jgi:hypothetical protein
MTDQTNSIVLHGLAADATVLVDAGGDGRFVMKWADFIENEGDGIEAGEIDPERLVRDMLREPERTALGGGGASAEWSIRLLAGGSR